MQKINVKQLCSLLISSLILFVVFSLQGCSELHQKDSAKTISVKTPYEFDYEVKGSLTKKLTIQLHNPSNYASLSLFADNEVIADNINIPKEGQQSINTLVRFNSLGNVTFSIRVRNAELTVTELNFTDITDIDIPNFEDISVQAGLDKVNSIKYGGPTIADLDNDGDYDFIVNNHNEADSKLYWNNGDGTVSAHDKNLSRWFMHDVHGTAAGDYDNDGDLDLVVTQGGGNGTNPSKANFYQNNDGKLVLMTGDVGIAKGGRGRGARWIDMDVDGDLDLMLINELGLAGQKPQHFFYENQGDASFKYREVEGLQDVHPSRVLVTDINNDQIDDIILFSPLAIWVGNGDFTFTDMSAYVPNDVAMLHNIMAVADLDIDNDGDLDLYLARGKEFEGGFGETPSLDFDPIKQALSIKPRGFKGVDKFNFSADGVVRFHSYQFLAQGVYRDKDYPLFLGSAKTPTILNNGDEMDIDPVMAKGWPEDISTNGMYFGYIGDGQWRAALVRDGDVFWGFKFSLSGVNAVEPEFVPQNRNEADILLRNDGDKFTDVSQQWNIPASNNSLGVTVGDFNNDSFQDIFVNRWGFINSKNSDLMLLNSGNGQFEMVTIHGANDIGGPGNGDMGQAFDFDLDGRLDLLTGNEGGQWYLFNNKSVNQGNYAIIRVGYSPQSNIDPISAEVIVETSKHTYRKRVGSAGAIFSQSLLNIVHFGLGDEQQINRIQVTWRDGSSVTFTDKDVNTLYDTDKLDPVNLTFESNVDEIRQHSSIQLSVQIDPVNADNSLRWMSSDESILTVDDNGNVTAVGSVGQKAIVSAISPINNKTLSAEMAVIEWFATPIESISILKSPETLLVGESSNLEASIQPALADNKNVMWTSNNTDVVSVNDRGVVKGLQPGVAVIKVISQANQAISAQTTLVVEPLIKPFIEIVDAQTIKQTQHKVGDNITLTVNYHAGTGNRVIASDEGGIRFWFRHFKNEWIPHKDTVLVDPSALGAESGTTSMTFSLDELTPTVNLPENHFYYIRASFTSSNGDALESAVYPIQIVE